MTLAAVSLPLATWWSSTDRSFASGVCRETVELTFKCCIVVRMASSPLLRIGELSKRTGVRVELLRAWERRYGLLRPTRSAGGLRLYAAADVERVRRMHEHLAEGLAAAEAAAAASHLGPDTPTDTLEDACRRLQPSLVVLCAVTGERVRPVVGQLRELAARHRLALGGAAAASGVLESDGVLLLTGDPIAEAGRAALTVDGVTVGEVTA